MIIQKINNLTFIYSDYLDNQDISTILKDIKTPKDNNFEVIFLDFILLSNIEIKDENILIQNLKKTIKNIKLLKKKFYVYIYYNNKNIKLNILNNNLYINRYFIKAKKLESSNCKFINLNE